MCGRYTLTSSLEDLQRRFGFLAEDLAYEPNYNVAPTQGVLTVANREGERRARYMRWGLVPSWSKDLSGGHKMINAKAKTLESRAAFRTAYRKRRCLVLAYGFFEWGKGGKGKAPLYVTLRSHEPFAFAGLWEWWRAPSGEVVRSCTIITTDPNPLIEPLHDRMPVILPDEAEALWLDPMTENLEVLRPLLAPFPAESIESYLVSALVNSPKNAGPECIEPSAMLPLPQSGPSAGAGPPLSQREGSGVRAATDT